MIKKFYFFHVFFLLFNFYGFAQITTQEIEELFSNWVEVMNTGENNKVKNFVKNNFDQEIIEFLELDGIANMLLEINHRLKGMVIEEIKYNDGKKIAAIVSSNNSYVGLILNTNENGKIIGWSETDTHWYGKRFKPKPRQEIICSLDSIIDTLKNSNEISVSVVVGNTDSVEYAKSIGMANRSYNIPIDSLTKFNLASASKMFTSVAIAILMERNQMSLEDYVSDYLDFEIDKRIKIKHLLEHSSGLKEMFNNDYWKSSKAELKTWHDLLKYSDLTELEFIPGSKYQYSNTGFIILGLLIEEISGQDYFSFVKENIWSKLDMRNTREANSAGIIRNVATGYTRIYPVVNHNTGSLSFEQNDITSNPLVNTFFINDNRSSPAGGVYSTALDMFRFISGLINGKIISKSTLYKFISQKVTRNFQFDLHKGYGYGFNSNETHGNIFWGHEGSLPGANIYVYHLPSSDMSVIILSNSDNDSKKLFDEIFKFMYYIED